MSFLDAHHFNIHDSTFNDIQGDLNQYHVQGSLHQNSGESGLAILRRAIACGASHDSNERYPPPRCHPETRTAVLDTIFEWVGDTGRHSSVLWLYGPAGAGKSAIAQTVAESCATDGRLGASFFFSRGKLGRNTGKPLFPTIAYQLAISVRETRMPISKAVEDDPSISDKSIEVQLQKLILEPYRWIMRGEPASMVVIIDGLDECTDNGVQQYIISLIGTALTAHRLPLRFLIASRPEPHIRDAFNHLVFQPITRRLALDESFWPGRDIHIFLRSGFADIHTKYRDTMASVPRPWPSQQIIDFLVQKSSGQFIYASTVLKFIDDEFSRPTDRLDIVLGLSGTNSGAFADLDQLYIQILSTNPNTSRLLRILGALLILSAPPSSKLLETLLFLERGDVGLTFRGLHSILDIPDSVRDPPLPIRVLHASLSDFLMDCTRSGKFFVDVRTYHADLTRCCLRIMTHWAKHKLTSGSILKFKGPAVDYALRNWFLHCSKSISSKELVDDLRNFNLYIWIDHTAKDDLSADLFDIMLTMIDWLQHISSPPEDLIQCYYAALDQLYYQFLSTNLHPHLLMVLGAIITLLRPHSPREIESLLFVQPGDVGLALHKLHSFLDIPDPCANPFAPIKIKPPFAPLSNFLMDCTRSGNFFIDAATCHAHLAHCCLRNVTEDIGNIIVYKYARLNWTCHLLQSKPSEELLDDLRNLPKDFFFQYPTQLLTVIEWLKNIPNSPADLLLRFQEEVNQEQEDGGIEKVENSLDVLRSE